MWNTTEYKTSGTTQSYAARAGRRGPPSLSAKGRSRGYARSVDRKGAFEHHLKLPAGIDERAATIPSMPVHQQTNRDGGRGTANP